MPTDERLSEVGRLVARATTRVNKLRVQSAAQQRFLTEARDYLAEALDVIQSIELDATDRATDEKWGGYA